MEEESRTGWWAAIIVAGLAAVVFLVLWVLRGGDIDKLQGDLKAAQSAASGSVSRLEGDLRTARSQAESAGRRIGELETKIKDDARRAEDDVARLERRLQSESTDATRRLEGVNAEIAKLKADMGAAGDAATATLRAELDKAAGELAAARQDAAKQLDAAKAESAQAAERIRALEADLAAAQAAPALSATAPAGQAATPANGEAAALRAQLARADTNLAAAQNAGAVLEEVRKKLEADLAQSTTRLSDAQKANAALQQTNAALQETGRKMQADLAAGQDAAKAREAELQKAIDDLTARLQAAVNGRPSPNGESEKVREAERVWKERLEAAELDRANREKAALGKLDQEWGERLAARQKTFAQRESELAAELKTAQDNLAATAKQLDDLTRRHAADIAGREQSAAAKEAEWRSALEKSTKDATAKETEWRAALDKSVKDAADKAAADEKAWQASLKSAANRVAEAEKKVAAAAGIEQELRNRVAAAEKDYAAREKALIGKYAAEAEQLKASLAGMEKALYEKASAFGQAKTGRAVGVVVEAMDNNKTLIITGGVKDRMRPGMKFDVFRPVGGGNRYIGMIKVIRVMDGYSMAVPTLRREPVMVCPVTGLAVLEPGAQYSPFVAGKDGKPLPLATADSLGFPTEAPAVGDLLDNPFYDPDRNLTFAVDDALAGERGEVLAAVELLGGAPKTGKDAAGADFLVVDDNLKAGAPQKGGPRRVGPDYLSRYAEPLPKPDPCAESCLPIR